MIACPDCVGRGWVVVDTRRLALGGRIMFDGLTDIERKKTTCEACSGRGERVESCREFVRRVTDGASCEQLRECVEKMLETVEEWAGMESVEMRDLIKKVLT